MRNCSGEGFWQSYSEDGCNTVKELLDELSSSFANVRNKTKDRTIIMVEHLQTEFSALAQYHSDVVILRKSLSPPLK